MCGPYGCAYGAGGIAMMLVMALLWIALLVGLILLVVWLARRYGGPAEPSGRTPLDVLKMRYARGEIAKDEYERMKQDLT